MQQSESFTILEHTESVCPICLEVVKAQVLVSGKVVYMEKLCLNHGTVTSYLWPDVEHYQWMNNIAMPFIRPHSPIPSLQGCLKDYGLNSARLRHPTLVEIEVTERCNLRCPVCFMAAEEFRASLSPDPGLDSIEAKYKYILKNTSSQTSIQLTGGEPTTRRDLPEIIGLGRKIGFDAIEVNTNGVVIGQNLDYVKRLAEAGISGIYLQFDGLTASVYESIRGANLLDIKRKAIENCREAGVQVVLAMTVIEGINDNQMGEVLNFALQNRDVIVGIAYQPAFGSGRFDISLSKRLTMGDVIFMLAEQSQGLLEPYDFWPLGCSHPLCSCSTYLVEDQGKLLPLTKRLTPLEYFAACNPHSPQGSVFADIAANKYPELGLGLSILIENYMDALNLDLRKVKECGMVVAEKDGGLVPFCLYQLTNIEGKKRSELQAMGKLQ